MDMALKVSEDDDLEALVLDAPAETFIANGEFLDFLGQGNLDFLTALTNLWDNLSVYEHPKIHGRSVVIHKPTVNILGGATVKGLGLAMPPEALGTGILSRLILIHSEMTEKKIAFPDEVPEDASDQIVETLQKIRTDLRGKITRTKAAEDTLAKMYKTFPGIPDARFADYSSRRFTHLLKIAMLIAISNYRTELTAEDAVAANTVLHVAETRMPKALGEFGKSKYSDVANTIMDMLAHATKPMSHTDVWKVVAKDLADVKELGVIMKNLLSSEKVQVVTMAGKQGYMQRHVEHKEWSKDLLDMGYLTEEERI